MLDPLARTAALASVVLLAVACSGLPGASVDLAVSGEIHIAGSFTPGAPCDGATLAPSILAGDAIFVEATDVQGPVATGLIGKGVAESDVVCVMPFAIPGIPHGLEQYRIVVGMPGVGVNGMLEHLRESDLSRPLVVAVAPQ